MVDVLDKDNKNKKLSYWCLFMFLTEIQRNKKNMQDSLDKGKMKYIKYILYWPDIL